MAATDHHVQLNVCQRISVGGFERGPVHVLLEMHDKFAAPQTCLELGGQDYNDVRLLRTIWVDDPAVADYLSTELGMPAIAGDFVFTRTPAGDADVLTWDWGVPGEDRSTVAYTRVDTVPGGSASLTRLFWHDGEDLFRMDYHDDEERPAVSTPASVGVLKAPMMHAAPEVGAYAGIYSLVDAGDYEGTIHSYEDFGCEQPSS